MKFLVFAASHRKLSLNRRLAVLAASAVEKAGHTALFKEYAELDMPVFNDELCSTQGVSAVGNPFAECASSADGIVLSAPEYNWSYPGSLKNILDWTSCIKPQPLSGKKIFLMCATPGDRGGVAGIMHLKAPFEALHSHVYPRAFTLSNANQRLNGEQLSDERQQAAFNSLIKDYIEFTRKLSH